MAQKKSPIKATAETVAENTNTTQEVSTPADTEVVTPIKAAPKKFEATDAIECVSITAGELGMIGTKTGINYTWAGRGDVTEVEYQDLVAAIRGGKKHITAPFFVIQNEDFLAEFPQVKAVYASMYSLQDLKDVFKLDVASMKATILGLPSGAQESIKSIASSMISKGQLDSVQKIKTLDEIFDTKFMLMTELYQ